MENPVINFIQNPTLGEFNNKMLKNMLSGQQFIIVWIDSFVERTAAVQAVHKR